MNTEQLRKEFSKKYKDSPEFLENFPFYVNEEWKGFVDGYTAAAKSRDELIGKLVMALSTVADRELSKYTTEEQLKYVAIVANQALAKAEAQGYGDKND